MNQSQLFPEGLSNKFNKRILLFILVIALIFSLICLIYAISIISFPIIKLNADARNRVNFIVAELGHEENQTVMINKILAWEKANIVDMNLKENENYSCLIRVPDPIILGIINNPLLSNYSLVTVTRCGKCGEFAGLFSLLANKVGIKSRVIIANNTFDKNHAWAEVYYGNTTIPVETDYIDGFNHSQFYSCKWLIQYRNIVTETGENISGKYASWCS